jgi:hypothetical protein
LLHKLLLEGFRIQTNRQAQKWVQIFEGNALGVVEMDSRERIKNSG